MKIVEFTAENVKRLKAIDITPAAHLQIVGGRNAQGKTSVLDAIWLALGGGQASKATTRPIRDGEDKASVRLDLGDLVVTRTWSGDKTNLKVESVDGLTHKSPQGVLDSLVGRLSFDPLEFTRLTGREQVAALLDLVDLGIDLPKLDAEREQLYDDRHAIGLQGKAIGDVPASVAGVPGEEVSAAQIISQIRAAQSRNDEIRDINSQHVAAQEEIRGTADEITRLQAHLKTVERQTVKIVQEVKSLGDPTDTADLEADLGKVEETNRLVRANLEARAKADRKTALRKDYDGFTVKIDKLDKSKADALAKAKFPVDGLGFDDSGVTYNGVPFSQSSAAEQIRVSLAMAMSLNPKLRVIRILDGSLLDAENLAMVEGMAKDRDYQVWVERVGNADGIGVVIEDGEVV